jgi:hypothetical protein
MSQSFSDLITQTQQLLRSYVRDQEPTTWLKFDVAEDARTFTVNDASVLSRGLVEVDSELVLVEDINANDGTFTVPPFGRGMEGSKAAVHGGGAQVRVQPLYPRSAVAAALNQTITGLGSQLWGVDTVTLKASPTRVSYELPEDTERVLSVSWLVRHSPSRDVIYARDWVFDTQANFPSGKGILLYEWPLPGDPITVTIGVTPRTLVEEDLFTDSMLPTTSFDVVMLGAASRLITTAGSYLTATRSVGAQTTLGAPMDPTQPLQIGRYLYQQYQERLAQEITRLQNRYSNRTHYQRGLRGSSGSGF